MALFIHSILLMILGAVLNESGIKITSYYFWLVIVLFFGIFLSYDIMTGRSMDEEEPEEKDKK